jgi:TolA-binding protein
MTEKELIKKIRGLREIKPRKEWVFLTKSQIFGQKPVSRMRASAILEVFPRIFQYKPVLVPVLAIFFLIGIFGLSQNSVPGDILYSVKKMTEKGQAFFVSDVNQPEYQLGQTNRRLEDLSRIAEQNQVKKLAPAIDEFQKTLSQATQNLKESPELNKEIIDQAKKIVESKEKIEETLGTQIGETEELENIIKELVGREIKDLENRTLTEEQTKLLEEAKEFFNAGDYSQALDKIWLISNN